MIITKNKELKKYYNMTDVAIYRFSPTGVLRGRHIRIYTHTQTLKYINENAEEIYKKISLLNNKTQHVK